MAQTIDELEMALTYHETEDEGRKVDGQICLNESLEQEWGALIVQREIVAQQTSESMAGPDTAELDAKIEALEQQIQDWIVTLHFTAISGDEYTALLAAHPEAVRTSAPAAVQAFEAALAEACYTGATFRGKPTDKPISEFRERVSYGQFADIDTAVRSLNQRTVDRDFLFKRSREMRAI